ncbi:MAG: hypothetical protein PHN31_02320, partial [Candidatus Gracilibacteria bacterium]|nr:hypothetical protein [Candidatus Gracilibacteria bacterium]
MRKKCLHCNKEFVISDELIEAYNMFSPVINGKKYAFNISDFCPDCYEQRRLSFRNKRQLYKRKCDFSNKEIISLYSPDKNYKIYDKDIWWSDKWSALDYGIVFDESKSFFSQLDELLHKVPFPNLSIVNSQNSEFNDGLLNSKNAYMCFGCNSIEDTYYTEESRLIKDSSDVWWSSIIEKSYECVDNANIYNSKYCYNGGNCINCYFCKKCNNCNACFMCYSLEGKKYHILNKAYTKEEYKEKMKDINLGDYEKVLKYQKIFQDFEKTLPHVNLNTYATENCIGDYIYNSKNCFNCFNVVEGQDCYNLYEGGRCSNVYDSSFIYDLEGPVIGAINVFRDSKNIYFSEYVYDNSFNIYYSFNLKSCKNCFACVGLVGKEYCIFNKQYKSQDYFKELEKIINYMIINNIWGTFFPPNISRFGYNETEAQEYYPMNRDLVINTNLFIIPAVGSRIYENFLSSGTNVKDPFSNANNKNVNLRDSSYSREGQTFLHGPIFNRSDYESPLPKVDKIIPANKLPDNIKDIPDDILNWAIKCQESNRPFKIIPEELKFYRENNIPIPRFHYDIRYKHRLLT